MLTKGPNFNLNYKALESVLWVGLQFSERRRFKIVIFFLICVFLFLHDKPYMGPFFTYTQVILINSFLFFLSFSIILYIYTWIRTNLWNGIISEFWFIIDDDEKFWNISFLSLTHNFFLSIFILIWFIEIWNINIGKLLMLDHVSIK